MDLQDAKVADNSVISMAAIILSMLDWNQSLYFKGKCHKRAKVQELDENVSLCLFQVYVWSVHSKWKLILIN